MPNLSYDDGWFGELTNISTYILLSPKASFALSSKC